MKSALQMETIIMIMIIIIVVIIIFSCILLNLLLLGLAVSRTPAMCLLCVFSIKALESILKIHGKSIIIYVITATTVHLM